MTTTPKEKCLYMGLPGIAILAVATFITMDVSADFQNDTFVKSVAFICSNALGWLLYCILQAQLQELAPYLPSFHRRKNYLERISIKECDEKEIEVGAFCHIEAEPVNEESPETENPIATGQDESQEIGTTSDQPELETVGERNGHPLPALPSVSFFFNSKLYRQRNEEMERQRSERRNSMLNAIGEYVQYTMSPYLSEEDLVRLTDEIMAWATNAKHKPQDIPLKNNLLSSIDLRHFIYNIAERLGNANGYTGEVRAVFTRRLFPKVFKDTDIRTIKNFRVKSAKDERICIDEPEKGDFVFHYESYPKSA